MRLFGEAFVNDHFEWNTANDKNIVDNKDKTKANGKSCNEKARIH